MNANDVRMYERSIELADRHGIKVELKGEAFILSEKRGAGLGAISTVNELYAYVCGFSSGFDYGVTADLLRRKRKSK